MRVAWCLPLRDERWLLRAVRPPDVCERVADPEQLARCATDVVIVAPELVPADRFFAARQRSSRRSDVIVCPAPDPTRAPAALRWMRERIAGVVWRGAPVEHMSAVLRDLPTIRPAVIALAAVADRLEVVSPAMLVELLHLFLSERPFHGGVEELAGRAGFTRRTLERHMAEAGFPSTKRLIDGANLLRAYPRLADCVGSFDTVARECGFPSTRSLRQHYRTFVSHSLAASRSIRRDEFVERVVKRVLASPRGSRS